KKPKKNPKQTQKKLGPPKKNYPQKNKKIKKKTKKNFFFFFFFFSGGYLFPVFANSKLTLSARFFVV
ncbi:MAG: hypothetical protein LH614_19575, partial [Pyrinomonadaceae bacterium]|nr:hypothetical protein [Pyrinomonadaceae bacterium]